MKHVWLWIAGLVIVLAVVVSAFGAGVLVGEGGRFFGGAAQSDEAPGNFPVFWQAWDIVEKNFVDRKALNPDEMTYGAIRGMVQSLGDEGHTVFLTPEEREQQQTDLAGKFSGIGAQLGIRESLPVIVAPFDGSPAQQAGVRAGDIIMKVDGVDVTQLPLNDIVSKIRGPEGTEVTLSLLRPEENKSLDVTIERGEIKVPAATWKMIPGTTIALIRLSQFSANALDDIKAAIEGAKAANATALVVDVRNNPGGLLDQAVKVTSQFLSGGDVVLEEDAQGNRKPYPVEAGGEATEIPIVVLINEGSASSAEIFAGAIQDHQRGKLVGETTFGTGTVLQPYELSDGSTLLLGTRQWLTPEGRLIRKHGIDPDEVVALPIETNLVSPLELENMTAEELSKTEDTQFLKALELLGAPVAAPASGSQDSASQDSTPD